MNISTVCIIGGGSTAHTLIPLLANSGKNVNLLTRNPTLWSKTVQFNYETEKGEIITTCKGSLQKISSNPIDVIPNADMIILCLPVSSYRDALNKVGPLIDPNRSILIGTIYGQGGFNWMVDDLKKTFNRPLVQYFAFGLVPWICRIKEYGRIGITYGSKAENVIAISDKTLFDPLLSVFLNDISLNFFKTGSFNLAENFFSLTMSVDNQVIHTSRLYSLYMNNNNGRWRNASEVPCFYKDYDDFSASELEKIDQDYDNIRNGIKKLFPDKSFSYMFNYLDYEHFSYASKSSSIKDSFVNSRTLGAIKTPVIEIEGGFEINKNHRFFSDDIYYGLCIAKWVAQKLKLETPKIDDILSWAQNYLGDQIINGNLLIEPEITSLNSLRYGIPTVYGLGEIDELVD